MIQRLLIVQGTLTFSEAAGERGFMFIIVVQLVLVDGYAEQGEQRGRAPAVQAVPQELHHLALSVNVSSLAGTSAKTNITYFTSVHFTTFEHSTVRNKSQHGTLSLIIVPF